MVDEGRFPFLTKYCLFFFSSGVFLGGVPALARARLRKGDSGVDVELTVRAAHVLVSNLLVKSFVE